MSDEHDDWKAREAEKHAAYMREAESLLAKRADEMRGDAVRLDLYARDVANFAAHRAALEATWARSVAAHERQAAAWERIAAAIERLATTHLESKA